LVFELILLISLILLSGFFSASETALFSFTQTEIFSFRKSGKIRMKLTARIMEKPNQVLTSLLLGNNAVNVMIILVANHILQYIPLPAAQTVYTNILRAAGEIVIIVLLLLVSGEIIPKNLALRNPSAIVNLTIYPFFFFHELIGFLRIRNFIAFFTGKLLNAIRKIFGDKDEYADHADIQFAVEMSRKEGHLSKQEAAILDRILVLKELPVSKIMLDRSQVKTVYPYDMVKNAVKMGVKNRISKLPVYDKQKDAIIGIFNVKKAILEKQKGQVRQFMTPPHYIPKVKASEMMLSMLLEGKEDISIIIDEFGTFSGIISARQIMDYLTQTRAKSPQFQEDISIKSSENGVYMDADMPLEEAEQVLGCSFPRGDYQTLNGFLISAAGSIPREKEWLVVEGMKFYIDEARPNKIIKVFIQQKGI
jgi:putative hemolysin